MAHTSSPLPAKIWAKSARGNRPGESLARHSAAVAAVLSQLALRSPSLATLADDPRLWHRAFWACWLHDLGKAAGAFQRYLRGERTHWEHRHEVLSLAFLPWVTPPETEDFPWIAGAIASHHRDARVIVGERYNPINPPEDLGLEAMVAELEDEAIVGIATWLRETGPAWLADSSLSRLGVGPAEAAPRQVDVDRFRREAPRAIIGALEAYRRLWRAHREIRGDGAARRQGLLLRGLVVLSDHLASAHARRLDPLVIPSAEVLLERAGAHGGQLKSHQVAARDVEGSLVLAAPTGSGKTEAALLWAGRQCKDRPIPSKLIYLLPYQASANAMRRRLRDQLETEVGLLHGRGAQVLYRELAEGGCDGQQAEREARRAVDLARLHHPPVWVATPYQLLRAAYRLPAYETIWTSLGSALIVIDEPHAYEPIRLGLLLGLLGELVQNWDVRVCAMTATLPTWLRALLQEALGAPSLPVDHDLFAQFRRHRLVLVPGEIVDAATIARIADEVRAGRSVLVGVNTVARAQIVRSALLQHLGPE
ncbi:MAG: CRISPR-associated helicase Cas3', partial [Chloroflexi bacterium]|nr:CRISPR-associated helicase Cas3' [Chloroflexota bacterium]